MIASFFQHLERHDVSWLRGPGMGPRQPVQSPGADTPVHRTSPARRFVTSCHPGVDSASGRATRRTGAPRRVARRSRSPIGSTCARLRFVAPIDILEDGDRSAATTEGTRRADDRGQRRVGLRRASQPESLVTSTCAWARDAGISPRSARGSRSKTELTFRAVAAFQQFLP